MKPKVRMKFCGMKKRGDIDFAIQLGVDAIGLIFSEQSPRYLEIDEAKKLLDPLPLFVTIVAVVSNPSLPFLTHIIDSLPIQLLQFHGNESQTFCRQFHLPYIKAIVAKNEHSLLDAMDNYHDAAAILVDSQKEQPQGQPFDWTLIPKERPKPLILAGGLNTDNVEMAIASCRPDAVDVCSGIETLPGMKDPQKMTAFVKACGAL